MERGAGTGTRIKWGTVCWFFQLENFDWRLVFGVVDSLEWRRRVRGM